MNNKHKEPAGGTHHVKCAAVILVELREGTGTNACVTSQVPRKEDNDRLAYHAETKASKLRVVGGAHVPDAPAPREQTRTVNNGETNETPRQRAQLT